MTAGVKLTARLMVLLALINYSYGSKQARFTFTAEATTTAATTTVASSPASSATSTVADATALNEATSATDTLTSTTTSASTSTPTTTKSTPPDGYLEPDFGAAPLFKMTFSIGYDQPWDESFRDCPSDTYCQVFREQIQTQIDVAFAGCPGYENGSIVVIKFDSVASEVLADQFVDANNRSANSTTYASYNASFDNVIILSRGSEVVDYIASDVEPTLASYPEVVDGSTDGMNAAASAQVAAFTEDPCASIGKAICVAVCYPCAKGEAYPNSVGCQSPCRTDQSCTIDEQNNITCKCKDKYLPFGDDCVHEDLIIGICAGVGGAIVLGLIILAIVLGCKLHKKNKKYKHSKHHVVESQNHRPENYEIIGRENDDRSIDNMKGVQLHHQKDLHALDTDSTDLATFTRIDSDDHPSTAAVLAVAAAADDDHHHHNHKQHDVAAKQVGLKDQNHLGSNLHEAATDYDNVSTDSLAQHRPGPGKTEPNKRQSDYYSSLYYPMPDDLSSHAGHVDPYNSFKPHVLNIDANKQYVIKRPSLEPATENHYGYN